MCFLNQSTSEIKGIGIATLDVKETLFSRKDSATSIHRFDTRNHCMGNVEYESLSLFHTTTS